VQNFDKILEFIKHESEAECKEIAINATRECERVTAEYAQKEKEAYTNQMKQGIKEIEERVAKLSDLASEQAKKKIEATTNDMLEEVLEITSKKLTALPAQEYEDLLKKLGVEEGCRPEHLVHQYREELAPTVISALFD
jgi:vacuolar-type H+-ATPase subunit E/Vma4